MTGGAAGDQPSLPITGIVVCQNEEERIEACLRSLAACRELIVVDSGSTDRTVPIIAALRDEGLPIVLLHQAWLGYAGQKQFALSRATQPWCLNLDADERLDDALRHSLPALIAAPADVAGWRLRREPAGLRRAGALSGGLYAKPVLRLVRRAKARYDETTLVHERLIVDGRTLLARTGLVRHDRVLPFAALIAKQVDYARAKVAERIGRGRKPSWLRLVFSPPLYFIRLFVLHRWFLCGRLGFATAVAAAFYALATEALHFEHAEAVERRPETDRAALDPPALDHPTPHLAKRGSVKVYFHGNCQALILHRLMAEVLPEWDVSSYEVFSDAIVNELDHYRHVVQTADIIVSQPIWTGYRGIYDLSTEWISGNKSESARMITFPSMFFRGLHPAISYIRDNGNEVQNVGMPYHDLTLLYLMAKSCGRAEIIEAMCSPSLYSAAFVDAAFALSLDELRRREDEDQITIKLSPLLVARGAQGQLFHAINHPTREVMAFVANAILATIGCEPRVSCEGPDDLSRPHIPPSPAVLHHLGGRTESDDFLIGDPLRPLSRREYYERTIDLMSALSPAALYQLITRQQENVGFLDRLKQDGIDRLI